MINLAAHSKNHQRKINRLRLWLPLLAVALMASWLVYSTFNQALTLRGIVEFIRQELDEIEDGFILTLDVDTGGKEIERLVNFEKMSGTGLSNSPFELGMVEMVYKNAGKTQYDYRAEDAILEPITGKLISRGELLILGPSGFRMSTPSAEINIGTFATSGQRRVVLSADGGLVMEAADGFSFDPLVQRAEFRGQSSMNLPSDLPGL